MQGLDKMDPITTFNHNNNSDGQYQQQQFEQKLDEAKFGLFHIRTILVSGVGFFCDAYDLFAITMVAPMLGVIYGGGKLDPATDGWLKASAAWGTLIGKNPI